MTAERVSLRTVDLDSCDKEPIQIPGSIQPHGVLLALAPDGTLTHVSRNQDRMFAQPLVLGERPTAKQLWSSTALREAAEGIAEDAALFGHVPPLAVEATIDGRIHDVVLHANESRLLMEFEERAARASELASFAVMAHRGMSRLRGLPDIASILAEAANTVRRLTGFDRVMAYRFHDDDSGEIVAEARSDALEPYLGRRFPASDIPVQARRLYTINTLRLIADVHDTQIPIDAFDAAGAPLDLSYSILRSVSPIHIEYLKNIGVGASMSVSIVIGGRLWGLIACHHRTAHRVTYAVRMACDVLAGVVAASVQLVIEREANLRRAAAVGLRALIVDLGADTEPPSVGASPSRLALGQVIPHDRLLFSHGNACRHEGIDTAAASELLAWLEAQPDDFFALNNFLTLPEPLRAQLHPLTGMLAMRYDRINRGWIVLMRNEQTATITWSGPPDKAARIGPLGARLTPDGSLAEWKQQVRGSAVPWDHLDLELAHQIMEEVRRATAARAAEMAKARSHLLAILGHDLRDPLAAVRMAAYMLERGSDQAAIGRRIAASTGRMGRLIAQVLDMIRLHGGLGLGLVRVRTDVGEFVQSLIGENSTAYPAMALELNLEPGVEADIDRDRLTQAVLNLLGNARQHGTLGEAVTIALRSQGDQLVLTVANVAPPLEEPLRKGLFDPLKRGLRANHRNPNGLGLGLYIASEAIKGHEGSLTYSHDGRHVVFMIEMPLSKSDARV